MPEKENKYINIISECMKTVEDIKEKTFIMQTREAQASVACPISETVLEEKLLILSENLKELRASIII